MSCCLDCFAIVDRLTAAGRAAGAAAAAGAGGPAAGAAAAAGRTAGPDVFVCEVFLICAQKRYLVKCNERRS